MLYINYHTVRLTYHIEKLDYIKELFTNTHQICIEKVCYFCHIYMSLSDEVKEIHCSQDIVMSVYI